MNHGSSLYMQLFATMAISGRKQRNFSIAQMKSHYDRFLQKTQQHKKFKNSIYDNIDVALTIDYFTD